MKYPVVVYLFALILCGCEGNETITGLLIEQKAVKDSADNLNESIGRYLREGLYDSAETQKSRLKTVYSRLAEIQSSIDRRSK